MYGSLFAKVYNDRWPKFGARVAPAILRYYEAHAFEPSNRHVLDLCCGTGAFSLSALERGYSVLGLDYSKHMLEYAKNNAKAFVENGQARFLQGLCQEFDADPIYGLIVSVFDSLNHLPDLGALEQCFSCAYRAARPGASFVFDLNTRRGLKKWNTSSLIDDDGLFLLNRGRYFESAPHAWVSITGFVRTGANTYEKFQEDLFNTVFVLEDVQRALMKVGWSEVRISLIDSLETPLASPEKEDRVFFVVRR